MLHDLFRKAVAARTIGDIAYGDGPEVENVAPAPVSPAMPAITINIMLGDAKKKKKKEEHDEGEGEGEESEEEPLEDLKITDIDLVFNEET